MKLFFDFSESFKPIPLRDYGAPLVIRQYVGYIALGFNALGFFYFSIPTPNAKYLFREIRFNYNFQVLIFGCPILNKGTNRKVFPSVFAAQYVVL